MCPLFLNVCAYLLCGFLREFFNKRLYNIKVRALKDSGNIFCFVGKLTISGTIFPQKCMFSVFESLFLVFLL